MEPHLSLCQTQPHWSQNFVSERARLLASFGAVTEGGSIEGIQHIGGTSVAGLPAKPIIDIGLAVWPYPFESAQRSTLEKHADAWHATTLSSRNRGTGVA